MASFAQNHSVQKLTLPKTKMSKIGPTLGGVSPTEAVRIQHNKEAFVRTSATRNAGEVPLGAGRYLSSQLQKVDVGSLSFQPTENYIPPLERFWVRAPKSPQTTVATRREWFRIMTLNVMTDIWTPHYRMKASALEKLPKMKNHEVHKMLVEQNKKQGGALAGLTEEELNEKFEVYFTKPVVDIQIDTTTTSERKQNNNNNNNNISLTTEEKKESSSSSWGEKEQRKEEEQDAATPEAEAAAQEESQRNEQESDPFGFLQWQEREKYILEEMNYYDPDILCLNEINKVHFNGSLWRNFRRQGYGGIYVSARKDGWKNVLRLGETTMDGRTRHKVDPEQDIGNVILYHKGRFFPHFMPGIETPKYLHFANICGLRDKVTNCHVICACVQFSPGEGKAAMLQREEEAKQLCVVLGPLLNRSSDRAHQGLVVTGDFNNTEEDEPCVAIFRDKYFSAYDIVGGPRWTTWYRRGQPAESSSTSSTSPTTTEQRSRHEDEISTANNSQQESAKKAADDSKKENVEVEDQQEKKALVKEETNEQEEADPIQEERKNTIREFDRQRALRLQRNEIKKTSDFMFFDSKRLTALQVLDIPSDEVIEGGGGNGFLPMPTHPSHHMSLITDICWNHFNPDVGEFKPHRFPFTDSCVAKDR